MTRSNKTVINDGLDALYSRTQSVIIDAFRKLRDDALSYAQTNHAFKNQTFNLEDSYGAAIYYNGVIIEKTLSNKIATNPRSYSGMDYYGHEEAERFLNDYDAGDGYSLVVVAGQFYAAWVEAIHGLDVLTGAFQLSKDAFQKAFKNTKTYYNKQNV